jgi:ABC-type antimicrobial peptide transport system permease subunit
MSIRTALGAPRSRLIRQLLTEAELLSMGGGLLGIAGAWAVSQLLWNFRPAFLQPGDLQLALDWRVCAFTAVVSVLTGLLFGIAPVFRATMPDLSSILNSGGRGGIQGGGRNRLRKLAAAATGFASFSL